VAGNYFINLSDFKVLLEKLLETSQVFAPLKENDRVYYEKISKANLDKIVYDTARPVDPVKSVLYLAREVIAKYFLEEGRKERIPIMILGVKACDAAALLAYDKVMLEGGVEDPVYKDRRSSCFLIGTDCDSIWPTCFCTKVGLKPYPEGNVDLNLSTVEHGFVVDILSPKGQAFFDKFPYYFRKATIEEMADARNERQKTLSLLQISNNDFDYKVPIHETIKGTLNSPEWKNITRFCVECGACNISCPSCTCFMFQDLATSGHYERTRYWDACLKGSYGRVAGGANSRLILSQRYNNRLQCKFDYSFDRLKMYTCTGCGRCIEACPAKIDMRKAIKDLECALAFSAKLE